MIIHKIARPVEYKPTVTSIFPLADLHFGSKGHCKATYHKVVDRILHTKNPLVLVPGDITDDDRPTTRQRRFQMYADRPEALDYEDQQHQAWLDQRVIPELEPIAEYIGGMLDGDHFRIYRNGRTSTQYICDKLKVKYLGERMAWVRLAFSVGTQYIHYLIHIQHGVGAASTPGGDINALIRQVAGFKGDLFLAAHTHKAIPSIIPVLGPDASGSKIVETKKAFVRCGGFLRSYLEGDVTYAERAGYQPLTLGCPTIEVVTSKSNPSKTLTVADVRITI